MGLFMRRGIYIYSGRKLDCKEKRQIIENITENIIIGEKDITINLCYLPSISEIAGKRQRSRRDSNPRYLSVQRFSRPSPSATRPLLQILVFTVYYRHSCPCFCTGKLTFAKMGNSNLFASHTTLSISAFVTIL